MGTTSGNVETWSWLTTCPCPWASCVVICGAQGHHDTDGCPGVKFRPVSTRWPQTPCLYCQKSGHEVPTCWIFARDHGLSVPYWWRCRICEDVGVHAYEDCPSLKAYVGGNHGQVIVFDLETTGLSENDEILEIAACPVDKKDTMFQSYVLPNGPINPRAARVNNFSMRNGDLHKLGRRVNAVFATKALDEFVGWLEKYGGESPILVAHNCRGFDAWMLLMNLIRRTDACVRQRFYDLNARFGDTLPLCQRAFPGISVRLGEVYSRIFKKTLTNAHEAQADVLALVDILNSDVVPCLPISNFRQHVFSVEDVLKDIQPYLQRA